MQGPIFIFPHCFPEFIEDDPVPEKKIDTDLRAVFYDLETTGLGN